MVKPAGFAEVWEQIHALTADEDYSSLRNRFAFRFRPKGREFFDIITALRCRLTLTSLVVTLMSRPKGGGG